MMNNNTIIIVAPHSVHTIRYINGISKYFSQIILITNHSIYSGLPDNVNIHYLKFTLSNLATRFRIAKIIRLSDGCTIHIHQANSYAYHTLKAVKLSKCKFKVVLTAWGSDILLLPKRNILAKQLVKYNLAHSDVLTCDSLYVAAQIKHLCPQVKELHTINFGVENFPQHVDIENKENIILSNRLHKPLYNIDKIIQAYAKMLKNTPNCSWVLVIAGAGEQSNCLKQLASSLNIPATQIMFTGMLSPQELIAWYQKSKLFISIPDSDATSSSLLEAMSYGCYPLLSNLPANLEWVIDGVNGAICANLDNLDLDLHDAIKFVAANQRYKEIATFNHTIIKHKALFNSNLKRFLDIL